MLLAIETSQPQASVYLEGAYRTESGLSTDVIIPMIDAVLAEKSCELRQIDCIAVSRGPGTFTGVRLGVAVAQGLAIAHKIPLVSVCSLMALAVQGFKKTQANSLLVAVDARMGQVYWAEFTKDLKILTEPSLHTPNQITPTAEYGYGNGFTVAGFTLPNTPEGVPTAEDVAVVGKQLFDKGFTLAPTRIEPAYVRNDVAHKPQQSG